MSPLISALCAVLPPNQVIHDELRRLAYGTDASFYRLTPEVITWWKTRTKCARC